MTRMKNSIIKKRKIATLSALTLIISLTACDIGMPKIALTQSKERSMLDLEEPVETYPTLTPTPDPTSTPDTTPTPDPTSTPDTTPTPDLTPTPIPTPAAVKKVSVKNSIEKKVVLSWKKASGATKYKIYRSKKKNTGFKLIGSTKKNTFTDKKVQKKKTVYYRVTSVAKNAEATPSKSVKVYVYPKHPKTVIIGECFAVALEMERNRFPSYYRFIGKAGMSMYSILNDNTFSYNGVNVTPLEKAAMMKPDRLIFLVGANFSGSYDPKKSAHQLVKMKKLMKKINPHIQMVVLSVSPWKKNSKYGKILPSHQKRHAFNSAYRAVAKADKNIYYCALTLRLEDANYDLKPEYDGGDGLHWSWLARSRMAGWIQKWCKKKFHSA